MRRRMNMLVETLKEIGVPIVQVIVPGLDLSVVGPERVGGRVKNVNNRMF
jgi:ribosomal protein S12 methylthiotransferase accessory factor YcaO